MGKSASLSDFIKEWEFIRLEAKEMTQMDGTLAGQVAQGGVD
jgi:hypothetical protein